MESEFQNVIGKSVGEVMRDISDFLACSCVIHPERKIDLAHILPDLSMAEQFSFALLSEALTQGIGIDEAERFYRHAAHSSVPDAIIEGITSAFRNPEGEAYRHYRTKYGNSFTLFDGSYWSTCLALGIDAGEIEQVLHYLRLFTVCLMEYAYMGDRNPKTTYTWTYYESFRAMLDDLTAPPEPDPLPLKVRALGGTAGKREGESYALSLGIDIENPNPDRMAYDVEVDVTLKDRNGDVIATVKDRICSIDPGVVYHYGVTRKIRGAATASISAVARAGMHLKLSTPIMKHIRLTAFRQIKQEAATSVRGDLRSEYDTPLRSLTFHYQFLSTDNKILGGGSEWISEEIAPKGATTVASELPLVIKNATKVVYSFDFDAMELI